MKTSGPKIDRLTTSKLHDVSGAPCRSKGPWLTFVLCTNFQMMMGTTKIGMPIYEAMKSPVLQLPFKKTGNPVMNVIIVAPTNPYHALKGWNGLFQGRVSRLTPCAFIAAWNRM